MSEPSFSTCLNVMLMLICRDAYFVAVFGWAELSIGLVAWRGFFLISDWVKEF